MRRHFTFAALSLALAAGAAAQSPVTAFTYQGRLMQNGAPANGTYDFSLRLYLSASALLPIGEPVALEDVQVSDGLFTAKVDFGQPFDGADHWISISVRPGSSTGTYTSLSPRQQLTPAPSATSALTLKLPYFDAASSNAGLLPGGLIRIFQSGTDNAIFGQSNGPGAGLYGLASAGGTAIQGVNTGNTGRAGWFEITSNANAAAALFSSTSGTGNAVEGVTTGTGRAVAGIKNGPQGQAGYFRIGNNANTAAAVYAETTGNGPAVYAKAAGLGPALQIAGGYIKVDGAGENTGTPVFVHVVSQGSLTNCGDGYCVESVINHPLCNNAPGAMLVLTEIAQNATVLRGAPVGTRYNAATGRWHLYSFGAWTASTDLNAGQKFVIMVIRP